MIIYNLNLNLRSETKLAFVVEAVGDFVAYDHPDTPVVHGLGRVLAVEERLQDARRKYNMVPVRVVEGVYHGWILIPPSSYNNSCVCICTYIVSAYLNKIVPSTTFNMLRLRSGISRCISRVPVLLPTYTSIGKRNAGVVTMSH